MHDAADNTEPHNSVVSNRTMNIAVALALMIIASVVMVASYRLGSGWSKDVGPDSGYFPFYVALFLFISSAVTLLQYAFARPAGGRRSFIARHELMMVLQVLVPMTVFVVASVYIGIYISMFFFIGFFMMWLGKYPLIKTLPVALGTPIILFVVFEIWFLVPLPKGPFEAWLGY
jgi:putative tricarboxylic transport membrane protein